MEKSAMALLSGLVQFASVHLAGAVPRRLALPAAALALAAVSGCEGQAADAPTGEDSRRFDLGADSTLSDVAPSNGETGAETRAGQEELPDPPRIVIGPPARFVPATPAELAEGAGIVASYSWALALGKALFWDQQVGSDGQACASCHFNAGADVRVQNQLNPGFLDLSRNGDEAFGSNRSDTGTRAPGEMPSGNPAGANITVVAGDFPLHRLADETQRDSAIITDTNDVVGSMGAFAADFEEIGPDGTEHCGAVDADIFHVYAGGERLAARQVEPRHTPSTINAVFNVRQFWDGRANNLFNGVGVFGQRDIDGDPNLRLIVIGESGSPELGALSLENASLASQAVGPPLSEIEMSCRGRTFADVGRKLLARAPLALQHVAPGDSVLGALAHPHAPGLQSKYTYAAMIRAAFAPKYWSAPGRYLRRDGELVADAGGYTQMETNMSMFWGISILLYESTLISDQSEFDSLVASNNITFPNCNATEAVDPLLARGCKIFFRFPFGTPADGVRGAGCSACHAGQDLFTEAAVQKGGAFAPLLQVPDVNNDVGTRDLGFSNIGTRPASVDILLGGSDPYGNPLSFGRQWRDFLDTGDAATVHDPFLARAIANNALVRGGAGNTTAKLESDGATKIPTIRNVALNPPYFSYGGYASLRQVLKFYNRGGNRRTITAENQALEAHGSHCTTGEDTGSGPDGNHAFPVDDPDCGTNVTGLLTPLGLLDCDANGVVSCDVATDDLSALERFMESLSDRRVQCDQAPFDHPELALNVGHALEPGEREGTALDERFLLPAVGFAGYDPSSGLCIPNTGDLFAPGAQARVGGGRVILPDPPPLPPPAPPPAPQAPPPAPPVPPPAPPAPAPVPLPPTVPEPVPPSVPIPA
jgi:cytochrome c peroxidase